MVKLFQLKARRFFRHTFQRKSFWLSVGLLIFSFFVLLMVLFPILYDRVPLYSYFIQKWELPISYELDGKIEVLDANGYFVNRDVEVFIGGYSTKVADDGEFKLVFSAPTATKLFVVVQYVDTTGRIVTKTELLIIGNGMHSIKKEFKFYA